MSGRPHRRHRLRHGHLHLRHRPRLRSHHRYRRRPRHFRRLRHRLLRLRHRHRRRPRHHRRPRHRHNSRRLLEKMQVDGTVKIELGLDEDRFN